MSIRPALSIAAGAVLVAATGQFAGARYAQGFVAEKAPRVEAAIADAGGDMISARFENRFGSLTRHPVLSGGENLDEGTRAEVARAVGRVPGIGGVFWADGTAVAESDGPRFTPMHCQEDVNGLVAARTIRFEEGSAALTASSRNLLDEVAQALRPCLGAIIAVEGHTDDSGSEAGNMSLSRDRALAVRRALMQRGIPSNGLVARGMGADEPVEGLAPSDPANRRIEFSVLKTEPLRPTPVDTPGPR